MCDAPRRVPARRPGNFLLLAQKKVTKEEGPNRIWLVARDALPREFAPTAQQGLASRLEQLGW